MPLTVTVKQTAGGYASHWIADNVQSGTMLEVLPPAGMFMPSSLDAEFLLLAAGSGITPVMSILKSVLLAGSGRIVLVYANRDERSVIFGPALRELAASAGSRLLVVHWLDVLQGVPTADGLMPLIRPVRRMADIRQRARPVLVSGPRCGERASACRRAASGLSDSYPCSTTRSMSRSQSRAGSGDATGHARRRNAFPGLADRHSHAGRAHRR